MNLQAGLDAMARDGLDGGDHPAGPRRICAARGAAAVAQGRIVAKAERIDTAQLDATAKLDEIAARLNEDTALDAERTAIAKPNLRPPCPPALNRVARARHRVSVGLAGTF